MCVHVHVHVMYSSKYSKPININIVRIIIFVAVPQSSMGHDNWDHQRRTYDGTGVSSQTGTSPSALGQPYLSVYHDSSDYV